jgi:hypothetical protein
LLSCLTNFGGKLGPADLIWISVTGDIEIEQDVQVG